MAKVNPVMKHAPVVKTKARTALEEFMETIPPVLVETEGGLIDNSPQEWIDVPDASLDPIVESAVVAEQLDTLADDVDASTTAASMESYRRIFTALTDLTGHPIQPNVSVESFKQTKGGKKQLAKAIRDHAALINSCVLTSLEEYADDTASSIDKQVADYKQALARLSSAKSEVDVPDQKIKIDHKRIWDMWFVDNSPIKPTEISKQVSEFEELAEVISRATDHAIQNMGKEEGDKNVDRAGKLLDKVTGNQSSRDVAIPKHKDIYLMFNTKVSFSDGRAKFTREATPKPGGDWTLSDFGWIAFWGILGGPFGAIVAAAYRGAKGGTGEADHRKTESIREMHAYIDGVKKLSAVVSKIEGDVKQLNKAVTAGGDGQQQAVFKRYAAPILELSSKTIGLITEVTYGTATLFDKLSH